MLDGRDEDIIICGVVNEVLRKLPRISTKDVMKELREAKKDLEVNMAIPESRISATIRALASGITIARMWYAVFRKMVGRLIYKEDDFESFCERIELEVPHHKHLPTVEEMQRMAVGSFAKSVNKWDENNAPVTGSRYKAYKRLAEQTDAMLMKGEGLD